jgi:glucokinase
MPGKNPPVRSEEGSYVSYVIGIDLGGTKIIAALADENGRILGRATAETRAHEGAEKGLERIASTVEAAALAAGLGPRGAAAIGIGSPGPLDIRRGMILDAPNLKWKQVPLRDWLVQRFGRPVVLTNDCKAGGLGELRYGAGRGAREMVYFGIGTGVGGAVIQNGQITYGHTLNAGEIGHIVVDLDGPDCACGAQGCLEAIASGAGIGRAGERLAREAAARGAALTEETPGARLLRLVDGDPTKVHGGHVAQAAAAGDPGAQAIMMRAARAIGAAAGSMMNALGPEVVVIGGGVMAKNAEAFLPVIQEVAARVALPGCGAPVKLAALGEESVVMGAIALALDLAKGQG